MTAHACKLLRKTGTSVTSLCMKLQSKYVNSAFATRAADQALQSQQSQKSERANTHDV